MMGRKYDIVIFGASGFTGQFVVEEIAKLLRDKKTDQFKWAVAGRSKNKLTGVLDQATTFTGYDVSKIDVIEADLGNPSSIESMVNSCSILVNCVGPYRFYGKPIIEACLKSKTHHLDISGETQFHEETQLNYHKEAEKNGVYVVGACGWDSIPNDMGITFLKQNFKGDLNSVESYMEFGKKAMSSKIHHGTWESAVNIFGHLRELKTIREKLFPNPLPNPKYQLEQRGVLHHSKLVDGWCIPFMGTDKAVIERSERFFYEKEGKRPVQVQLYSKQQGLVVSIATLIAMLFVGALSQFRFGRYLMIKYSSLFTLGFVTRDGPTREQADFPFTATLVGEGWKENLAKTSEDHTEKPNRRIIVKVHGTNPGYGATCTCLVQAALTILREKDKMPSTGGVYTPASAFSKTSIVERLNETGLTFRVVSVETLNP